MTAAGEAVRLRQREFDLLQAFLRYPSVVLSRERLLSLVWGEDFLGDSRTIDVHVAWLRDKLKEATPRIETVWGVGYKLTPEPGTEGASSRTGRSRGRAGRR